MLLSFNMLAQKSELYLLIRDLDLSRDSLGFSLEINNISDQSWTIYKPDSKDICNSILKLRFISKDEFHEHEIFPCEYIIDLNSIMLNCTNSINLNPNDIFIQKFKFGINQITPYLEKNFNYSFFVELNLGDILFESDLKNIFKKNLKSSRINFPYSSLFER